MGLCSYESVSSILEDCEVPADHLLDGENRDAQASAVGFSEIADTVCADQCNPSPLTPSRGHLPCRDMRTKIT